MDEQAARGRAPTRGTAVVIGAGPAGLMAAERLAAGGLGVTIFDRMPSPGRKFLLAGRGGLNLTHGEPLDVFLGRYGPARERLEPAIAAFPPAALRAWCEGLDEPTVEGSSGRIFPRSWKTSPLLRAWLARLAASGVVLRTRHLWTGWDDDGRLTFSGPAGEVQVVEADATLLALGGASWPRLGSDGGWTAILQGRGIRHTPLAPTNCGFEAAWSPIFGARFAGQPLKSVTVKFAGRSVRGEALVTGYGLEGGAVYAHASALRETIAADGAATLTVDLRPDVPQETLVQRLARPRGSQSTANFLRKAAGLSPLAQGLLREHGGGLLPETPAAMAALVKTAPVRVTAARGLDRAISTAGGIRFDDLDERFMLRALLGVFAAGEMLDWEAPTGGYLLQATFATAVAAADGMLAWCEARGRGPG